ncbi:hypothetical protein AVEN_98207-1, partial [Araneus ventricosus]
MPRLPDPGHSISIHNSLRKQGIQQSRTYSGGNTFSNPRNDPTSDMENNSHQVSETTLDFLKNMNLGINTDNLWNESPNSVEINAPFCATDNLNQETVTKGTAFDEQNGHKLDFFPSYATASGEFLPLTSP